jgi:hypothetical protein
MFIESLPSLLIREKVTDILTRCMFFAEIGIACLTPSVFIDNQGKHGLHLNGLC